MLDMQKLADRAEAIVVSLEDSTALIGVWLIEGDLKPARATTATFARWMEAYPDLMVGLYDGSVYHRQIMDDAREVIAYCDALLATEEVGA